ncbi:coiled-coil domain-containing protein 149-like isoform X1 [Ornithodoros turicata]|uniref:coiled-coil domain-containing protein 149-like isoform X1 n=2 Tax=Ornithodoros turicata TaxID=34597 RepID=UPI003139C993
MSARTTKPDDDYQNLVSEMGILRCRLESKSEALLILTGDLERCQSERDQYKLMADQLRDRYTILKKRIQCWGPSLAGVYDVTGHRGTAEKSLAQLLCDMKEQNRKLQSETDSLRQKLQDVEEDNKLLRQYISERRNSLESDSCVPSLGALNDKQELVGELESLRAKCLLLERDLQAIFDEKEELVTARDAYRCKVERLNQQLNLALRGGGDYVPVDVDAVLAENRYLQEKIQLFQEEKSILATSLTKYKNIVEKKRGRGINAACISNKQIQQLLQCTSPDLNSANGDVRSLVSSLLESLSDKTVALNHQRKANKMLGKRITELESILKSNGSWKSPVSCPQKHSSDSMCNGLPDDSVCVEIEKREGTSVESSESGEAPRTVVIRGSQSRSSSSLVDDDDLTPELRLLISNAMQELNTEDEAQAAEREALASPDLNC